ncbi:hypothetical protein D3C79_967490 [compost metagenome]
MVAHSSVKVIEKTDVLIVEVQVDEAMQLLLVHQPLANARVAPLEVFDDLAHRLPLGLDTLAAVGVAAQQGGNTDKNRHGVLLGHKADNRKNRTVARLRPRGCRCR